ncbi:unnamed protein product [Ectocarpus sp. CCAP 1310/34]|nr:unnamed protein product [Ectocarpus sp. CCAP 1310/34]
MRLFGVLLAASWAIIASEASSRLDVIDLPTGFFPEGITNGEGWTAFVGSLLSESSTIFRIDVACDFMLLLTNLLHFPIGSFW